MPVSEIGLQTLHPKITGAVSESDAASERRGGWIVARPGIGRYAVPVRKIVLQRWALIFLLVSRLVIGELGHAMPTMHGTSHAEEAAMIQSDPAVCPEHELGPSGEGARHAADPRDAADTRQCCKSGECECPCLHVPGAAVESITVGPADLDREPPAVGIHGLMLQRLSSLFRPPA